MLYPWEFNEGRIEYYDAICSYSKNKIYIERLLMD